MQQAATNPITDAQRRAVAHKVELAMSKLVLRQPFFATLVLQRPVVYTDTITPTAGADARGRVYINPRFVIEKDLSVDHLMFLLAHETMHIAFLHCLPETIGGRNPKACNIAMDKVINETLIVEKCGEFIEGGQRHAGAETKAWEDLYIEPEDDGGGGGSGDPGLCSHGGIGDDLLPCPDGEPQGAEAEAIRDEMRGELAAAKQAAKMQGSLSANMARLVDELLYVPTPYHIILERFMTGFVNQDYSWKRPNRRFVGRGLYLPGLDRVPRMGKVGLIMDVSGSIDQRTTNHFQAHINRLAETCQPEEIIVLYVDSRVAGVERFDEFPIKLNPVGGGGTDMREGWNWFDKNEDGLDCIVCLTDGETPWPDHVSTPSLVVTTDKPAPDTLCESITFTE